MKLRTWGTAALVGLALTGCGEPSAPSTTTSSGASGSSSAASSTIAVVASTNVWGSVVQAVGGDAVQVTSIIDDPDKDPHEYEADARNQLAISKAAVVVENGGGYDDFVDTMLRSASTRASVINAADVSGHDQEPATGEFNEHVWYDLPTVAKVADAVAADLGKAAPDQASTFTSNASAFKAKVADLEAQEATIKQAHQGEGVAITEPVPLYLLDAAGLVDKTPEEFSEAIEEGTDVAPGVLKQTLDVFARKQVRLLAYNEQTTGPQTEAVLAAAKDNGVAVVPVTETLPAGKDYLGWMGDNVRAVSAALGS